jgi:hypothetical protein
VASLCLVQFIDVLVVTVLISVRPAMPADLNAFAGAGSRLRRVEGRAEAGAAGDEARLTGRGP